MPARRYSTSCDYSSASSGYTAELWRFWQRYDFVPVRMGNHREASSGYYTAMALLPIDEAGKRLAERGHQHLRRNAEILARWNGMNIPLVPLKEAMLSEGDWAELAGFAFAHRPLLTSLGYLSRLLEYSESPLPALHGRIQAKRSDTELCQQFRISGRRALLAIQCAETAQALNQLDAKREQQLRNRIVQRQFFH